MSDDACPCIHSDGGSHDLSPDDICVRAVEEVPATTFGDTAESVLGGQPGVFAAGHQPRGSWVIAGPAPLRELTN
jgi:hypothetical protein